MNIFLSFILASLAMCAVLNQVPPEAIRRGLPDGYSLADVTWTVPIVEGGADHTFNGTVQEVFAQINHARAQQGLDPLDDPTVNSTERVDIKRSYDKTLCNVGLTASADEWRIYQGIEYLQGVKGRCGMTGPRVCGRISCSWDAAIFWCNDNNGYSEYDCSKFADYAQKVNDNCWFLPKQGQRQAWGQAFDTEKFNVMCGYDKC
ncbi:hypothetical protein GGR57DRAFT_156232 [Xylariaceae sp. FL1272]|nr:hypothetical protein GGR57DRAFT_156232 [Xylariaceae sp. FL1272]